MLTIRNNFDLISVYVVHKEALQCYCFCRFWNSQISVSITWKYFLKGTVFISFLSDFFNSGCNFADFSYFFCEGYPSILITYFVFRFGPGRARIETLISLSGRAGPGPGLKNPAHADL